VTRALVLASLFALLPGSASAGQLLERSTVVPALRVLPDGGAALITSYDPDDDASPPELRLRRAAPGGAFDGGVLLGRANFGPEVGLAADGSGVVLTSGAGVASFTPDGAVGPVTRLSPSGERAFPDGVYVAPSGAALALWYEGSRRREQRLTAAVRDPGAAQFGPPQRVLSGPSGHFAIAGVGDAGDAVILSTRSGSSRYFAAVRRPGGAFGPPQWLSRRSSGGMRAAIGADGTIVVAHYVRTPWRDYERYDAAVRRAAPGAPRLGPARVIDRRGLREPWDLAVAPNGRILFAAVRDVRRSSRLEVWDAAPGGPLALTGIAGRAVVSQEIAVDVDGAGRAVVAWSQNAPRRGDPTAYGRMMAARREAIGTPFTQPEPLHDRSYQSTDPYDAALAPGGAALVAWSTFPAARDSAAGVTWLR
jgi:hypothetical protein